MMTRAIDWIDKIYSNMPSNGSMYQVADGKPISLVRLLHLNPECVEIVNIRILVTMDVGDVWQDSMHSEPIRRVS